MRILLLISARTVARSIAVIALVTAGCQSVSQSKEPRVSASGAIDHIEIRRLLPGEDVRAHLESWAKEKSIKAASVLSAVGSLKQAAIRYADQKEVTILTGPFEIVSMSGLIANSGAHVHLAIADKTGKTVGGHLGEGAIVYTTVELVIGVYRDVEFRRELETRTGYKELFLTN